MTTRTGRCLCGAVRYRFSGAMLWQAHCHCESCRRNTSAPLTTFFAVPKHDFAFEGDEPGTYASSPGVRRRFCRTCGTPMSYEYSGKPDEIHLYAANLDESGDIAPERHDFWNERVPWLSVTDDLPKHEA
jgi:hypothetical protein